MAQSTAKAVSADELAFKQRKLGYRLKKSRVSYVMMAPYFILFFLFTVLPGGLSSGYRFSNLKDWIYELLDYYIEQVDKAECKEE